MSPQREQGCASGACGIAPEAADPWHVPGRLPSVAPSARSVGCGTLCRTDHGARAWNHPMSRLRSAKDRRSNKAAAGDGTAPKIRAPAAAAIQIFACLLERLLGRPQMDPLIACRHLPRPRPTIVELSRRRHEHAGLQGDVCSGLAAAPRPPSSVMTECSAGARSKAPMGQHEGRGTAAGPKSRRTRVDD